MPLTTRTVKTAQAATDKWGSKVAAAGLDWSDGLLHPKRDPFNPANINGAGWQAGVSTAEALALYSAGMAAVDTAVYAATVNGAGRGKYTASGSTKKGKVFSFQQAFLPRLGSILSNLDSTAPRGPRGSAQNRTRLNTYLDGVASTRGSFR